MDTAHTQGSDSGQGIANQGVDIEDYLHPQGQDVVKMTSVHPNKPSTVPGLRYTKNTKANRFDSGVADLDDIHVSPDHRQTANGKQRPSSTAKNYDYADYGGHQYEELPHPKAAAGRQTSPESCSEYQSSAGTVTAETPSESGDTAAIVRNSDQRKRYNPLYDTMVGSSPNIYNKVKAAQPNNVVQERLRMLKIIVIFLILISCLSLAISLYIVIVYAAGPLTIQSLQKELNSLHNNYSDLNQKLHFLETMMTGNMSLEYLEELGQRGPPGVGNLSACYMRDFDSSSSSQTIQTDTQWEPDNNVLKANVVMFVMCGVRNGVDRYLEVRESSAGANKFQYRCLCSGKTSTSTTRTCITHFWLCPRESFGGS
ncbi:uncharacterized protein LOC110466076 isoform X5 [Mizuhopecten yessoensis]|uniref:uncharacterized protein LOC110466076 isoform X5 n=1 Tax=Mizuhopecten yessoensis TaxID=6573 RepID=UPI000B45B974|nr:uncharacterized protein LOC110466076 isoform X5 [Mizuhopecten yessoensis]